MKEHQHIEWKETWRDEYLKWICGFANAEGGVLVIGRNDRGEVIGLKDAWGHGIERIKHLSRR
ncbi:MAG TPA: ATP-binding protein [Desulfuromonadaceae bacterium]|jgi:ATP-dependent DNA helicase RecG